MRLFWLIVAAAAIITVRTRFHAIVSTLSETGTVLAVSSNRWLLLGLVATAGSVGVSALVRQRTLRVGDGSVTLGQAVSAGLESGVVQMTTPAGGIVATGFLFRRFTGLE